MSSAEASPAPVGDNSAPVEKPLTPVSDLSTADTSPAPVGDKSAPVEPLLTPVSRDSTVASRYRSGGSLRDNGDGTSEWPSLAEATRFGEPSSAQLADATTVARRQCWRIIPTCWDLVGAPLGPTPLRLHRSRHPSFLTTPVALNGSSLRVGALRCGLLNRSKKSLMRLGDFGPQSHLVVWLDDDSLRRVVLERGSHECSGFRVLLSHYGAHVQRLLSQRTAQPEPRFGARASPTRQTGFTQVVALSGELPSKH